MRYKKIVFWASISIIFVVLAGYFYLQWQIKHGPYRLPDETLRFDKLQPSSAKVVFGYQNSIFCQKNVGEHLLFYRSLERIDEKLKNFVVFLEDSKFYSHDGLDIEEIGKSVKKNLETQRIKRGGSSITQQLAKNLFLDQKRSFTRKLFEIPWTLRLEKDLKKNQILELYFNSIEWGPYFRGVEASARYFFGKSASTLSLGESMYLALIIPNPHRFDLIRNPSRREFLEKKKQWLVDRLLNEKKIETYEETEYRAADFGIRDLDDPHRRLPYPQEKSIDSPLCGISWGKNDTIRTSIDLSLQKEAESFFKDITGIDPSFENKQNPTFLLLQDGFIRAVLPTNPLIDEEMLDQLSSEEFEVEKTASLDPSSLLF